jgi:carbonic anhydrase
MYDREIFLDDLILRNRRWSNRRTEADPGFFRRLEDQQSPRYFWIGCSDSRVPATEIVDLDPGEMFVHRNVANIVATGDPCFEAALAFAVERLSVSHIIVVGHYGCGGIRAAIRGEVGEIGTWLQMPRKLYHRYRSDLDRFAERERENCLCKLNVLDQVAQLASHPRILSAWRGGRTIHLHAWIYSLANGLISRLQDPVGQEARQ